MNNKLSKQENWEREHFNKIAKEYENKYGYDDPFTIYKINKKVKLFVDSVKNNVANKTPKILEIGCGTGTYTFVYSKKMPNSQVLATDISEEMISLCKNNKTKPKNVSFLVKSAYNTALKKDSVDVVCGFYILHHIDHKKTKKEILRVLKPGGVVYFYEPNILNPVVYAIKSNKMLKRLIGDSTEEWAINPTKIAADWNEFKVVYNRTSEFVWPFSFVPFGIKVCLDKFLNSVLSKIPLLNLIGGSVEICLIKK